MSANATLTRSLPAPPVTEARNERRCAVGWVIGMNVVVWPAVILGAAMTGPPSRATVFLGFVVIASRLAPLRLHRASEIHGITFDEAVLIALLSVGGAGHAGLVFAVGVLVGHLAFRPGWMKLAFNAAQSGLAATLGAAAFTAIAPASDVLALRSVAAAGAAALVFNLVGFGLLAELFRCLRGQSWRTSARNAGGVSVASAAANIVLGLLLAFLVRTDARAVVLGLGVLVTAQVGFMGYAGVAAEGRRAKLLQDATSSLVAASADTLESFLRSLAELFSAGTAEIALTGEGEAAETYTWRGGTLTRTTEPLPVSHPAREALRRGDVLVAAADDGSGTNTALVALIQLDGRTLGALALTGREGIGAWGERDVALLGSLANEVAVALHNLELFEAVEQERERLEEESAKLADVVGATSNGIVVMNEEGEVVVWNQAMTTITGVASEAATGRLWPFVLQVRDAEGNDLLDPAGDGVIGATLRGERQGAAVSLQVLRRDGVWRWLSANLNPICTAAGKVRGAVLVAHDITAEREVEQLKADFIATVSHELRTPLTPLQGFIETLSALGGQLDAQQIDQIAQSMDRQVFRLRRMIEDLMLVAEGDAGAKRTLESEALELGRIVDVVVTTTFRTERERIVVDNAPGVLAVGDETAARRIVEELIENALIYTDGDVRVKIDESAGSAVVEVSDDGPGIGAWDQERVFRRFGRLGDHLHRKQGSGLGLAIARTLARELGGDLALTSDVGEGCVFSLQLPVAHVVSLPESRFHQKS